MEIGKELAGTGHNVIDILFHHLVGGNVEDHGNGSHEML
jgi:hypothetical protein